MCSKLNKAFQKCILNLSIKQSRTNEMTVYPRIALVGNEPGSLAKCISNWHRLYRSSEA